MKLLIVVLSLFSRETPIQTSDTLPLKHRIYKASIFNDKNENDVGYLSEIKDSTLMLSPIPISFNSIFADNKNIKSLSYKDISIVNIRRKGTTGRAILIGSISGLVVGAVAGFAEGDDPSYEWFGMTAEEKAITYGSFGSAAGVAIGAVIGVLLKKKFIIGGKKEKFDAMRMNVLEKAYGKQKAQ